MARTPPDLPPPGGEQDEFEPFFTFGDGEVSPEEKSQLAQYRRRDPEFSFALDRRLFEVLSRQYRGLREADHYHQRLAAELDQLMTPPWYTAIYLGPIETPEGTRALVSLGREEHAVDLAEGLTFSELCLGDQVFLPAARNVVLGPCPDGPPRYGGTATLAQVLDDGRLLCQLHDETFVGRPAAGLDLDELVDGDLLRFDPVSHVVFERLARPDAVDFLLSEAPDITADQVGGQDEAMQELLDTVMAFVIDPATARLYGLTGDPTVLLYGPPGNGKTTLARLVAAEVARLTGEPCRFAVVKPGEFEDPYVGVTQQRIRSCFASVRKAAGDGIAILFIDEVEALARHRGGMASHHRDAFLASFLAEVNGFLSRGRVAIISASNRIDMIDSAARQRLGSVEIPVTAPSSRGAREIFGIHLPAGRNYWSNGAGPEHTRHQMIETAVAMLYAPNAAGELMQLKFRSGKVRSVSPESLVSGRLIEQMCQRCGQLAFRRHRRHGDVGMRVADMEQAVSETVDKLSTMLTPTTAWRYLDLPQEDDVVAVLPLRETGRVRRPCRYRVRYDDDAIAN